MVKWQFHWEMYMIRFVYLYASTIKYSQEYNLVLTISNIYSVWIIVLKITELMLRLNIVDTSKINVLNYIIFKKEFKQNIAAIN